mgnify:CR=1 FL=1
MRPTGGIRVLAEHLSRGHTRRRTVLPYCWRDGSRVRRRHVVERACSRQTRQRPRLCAYLIQNALLIASKKVVLPALSSPTIRTENCPSARQAPARSATQFNPPEKRDEPPPWR